MRDMEVIDALMVPSAPACSAIAASSSSSPAGGFFCQNSGFAQAEPLHGSSNVSEDFGSPRADEESPDNFYLEGINLAHLEALVVEQVVIGHGRSQQVVIGHGRLRQVSDDRPRGAS